MSNSETSTGNAPLDAVDTDSVLFDSDTGSFLAIESLDYTYDGAIPSGTVEIIRLNSGEHDELDAETVDSGLALGQMHKVASRATDDPLRVLIEFAEHEMGRYASRLGKRHDYNGIDGVNALYDLFAASLLINREEQ